MGQQQSFDKHVFHWVSKGIVDLKTSDGYVECEIISKKNRLAIGVAISSHSSQYNRGVVPGWERGTIGWHGYDGKLYDGSREGIRFGAKWRKHDRVGVGIKSPHGDIFFTHNGLKLDVPRGHIDGEVYFCAAYGGKSRILTGVQARFDTTLIFENACLCKTIFWDGVVSFAPDSTKIEMQPLACGNFKLVQSGNTKEHFLVKSSQEFNPNIGAYFEIQIVKPGKTNRITLGICEAEYLFSQKIGRFPHSMAYQGNNGKLYTGSPKCCKFGKRWKVGARIGVGVMKGLVFFTHNNQVMNTNIRMGKMFKFCIGLRSKGAEIVVIKDPVYFNFNCNNHFGGCSNSCGSFGGKFDSMSDNPAQNVSCRFANGLRHINLIVSEFSQQNNKDATVAIHHRMEYANRAMTRATHVLDKHQHKLGGDMETCVANQKRAMDELESTKQNHASLKATKAQLKRDLASRQRELEQLQEAHREADRIKKQREEELSARKAEQWAVAGVGAAVAITVPIFGWFAAAASAITVAVAFTALEANIEEAEKALKSSKNRLNTAEDRRNTCEQNLQYNKSNISNNKAQQRQQQSNAEHINRQLTQLQGKLKELGQLIAVFRECAVYVGEMCVAVSTMHDEVKFFSTFATLIPPLGCIQERLEEFPTSTLMEYNVDHVRQNMRLLITNYQQARITFSANNGADDGF